jgi:hypothetical protein
MNNSSRLRAVLIGGSIAGVLDILFAITYNAMNGVAPVRLLQIVASGLLGKAALDGGVPTAILGLAGHFGMSYLWAALFVAAVAPAATRREAGGCRTVFGILVFFTMRPRRAAPVRIPLPDRVQATVLGPGPLSHMFFFGLPIAFAAARPSAGGTMKESRASAASSSRRRIRSPRAWYQKHLGVDVLPWGGAAFLSGTTMRARIQGHDRLEHRRCKERLLRAERRAS